MPQISGNKAKGPSLAAVASHRPSHPTTHVTASSMANAHPLQLLGAPADHPQRMIGLVRGPAVTVVVGTSPRIDTYHIPIELLRWNSSYFTREIDRLMSSNDTAKGSKKRKLDSEEETIVVKVENDADDQDGSAPQNPDVLKMNGSIELPHLRPEMFELFVQFIYMGYYPFEVDVLRQPFPYLSPDAQLSAFWQARADGQTPAARREDLVPAGATNVGATPVAYPRAPTAGDSSAISLPFQSIQPSIYAWIFSAGLGAAKFMNHAMLHIYSGLGEYFCLTPNTINFIWQRTPTESLLRRLIKDVLIAYWAEPNPDRRYIDRRPSLDEFWMKLFDAHVDLKSIIFLGGRIKRDLPPLGAYLIQPRLPTMPGVVFEKGRESGGTVGLGKGTEDGSKEKPKTVQESGKEDVEVTKTTGIQAVDVRTQDAEDSVAATAKAGHE